MYYQMVDICMHTPHLIRISRDRQLRKHFRKLDNFLVFRRNDLCEAKDEMQSVFKFSDVLFALKSDVSPIETFSGQDWYSGLVDLSSDVPPSRGIYWPRVVLLQVSFTFRQPLGQADLWSDVSPCRGI